MRNQLTSVFDGVYGSLVCGEYACSKECEPLTIYEAGKPIVSGLSLSCPWLTIGGSEPNGYAGKLYIGTVLAACVAAGIVTNAEELYGCEGPYVEYCGGKSPTNCSTATEGDLTIKLAVKCTLGGTTYFEDKTLKYRVVPNS